MAEMDANVSEALSGVVVRPIGSPAKVSAPASLSRWMVVLRDDVECLFGFADRHPRTGGLSWLLSTPLVGLDEERARAVTASGRTYLLGRRIGDHELDEEGRLAKSILLHGLEGVQLGPCDLAWLMACKWARHLRMTAPLRTDCEAVYGFMAAAEKRYLQTMFRSDVPVRGSSSLDH